MAQHPFPGPGHDGDEPVPGVPARDGADDVGERYLDWVAGEIEAGREEAPPEEEPAPAVTVSLGEAGDVGLEDLARMAEGLAGTGFSQDQAADVMPPGPVLGALTSQAVEDVASLDDDELLGVVLAARRLQARDEYLELAAVAEFARRREEAFEASKARGDKPRQREGEFPAEELGMELTCSQCATRRAAISPVERAKTGGGVFGSDGLLVIRKDSGENSMPGNRRPCPGIRSGAPGDPRDKVKAGLPESQSPEGVKVRLPEMMPVTGTGPCRRVMRDLR